MAFLRKIGSGLAKAAEVYGEGPTGLLQRRREQENRKQDEIELAKYVAAHPDDFETVSKLSGPLKIDLEKYRPSIDTLLQGERTKIQKDPYNSTPAQIVRDAKGIGLDTSPVMGKTAQFMPSPGDEADLEGSSPLPSTQYGPSQRPPIQDLINQAAENRASQDADVRRKLGIEEQTSQAQAHGQATGHAAGVHEAAPTALQDLLTQRAAVDPLDVKKVGAEEQARFDSVNDIGRQRVAARGAGLNAGASAAAQQPFQKPDLLFDQDGNAQGIKWNPQTHSYDSVTTPEGLGKQPTKLTQGAVDQVSSLNLAETEGVKVLATLHKLGLDKSDDPLDPRWTKFVVGTLGMAPADWDRADMQQRTAFVNAILTRSLMGGRPNQWVAELIQQHLPQGTQTGAQLTHVLHNVLGQGQQRRNELAQATRSNIKGPTEGMTLDQWLQFENGGFESGPQQESFYKLQELRNRNGGR